MAVLQTRCGDGYYKQVSLLFAVYRIKMLVFDWCYHGTVGEALATLDADGATVNRPATQGAVRYQFDDSRGAVQRSRRVEALAAGEIACVLAEPALTNIGIAMPDPGSTPAPSSHRAYGTLLVIGGTHTICVGPGGDGVGVSARLLRQLKTIGGGMPAAAYG